MGGLLRLKFSKGCKLLESYNILLILKQSEFCNKKNARCSSILADFYMFLNLMNHYPLDHPRHFSQ